MAQKRDEFVVSDRRRFAPEGELRSDVITPEEETQPVAQPSAAAEPKSAPPAPEKDSAKTEAQGSTLDRGEKSVVVEPFDQSEPLEDLPVPPTAQEQQQQSDAYKASGRKIDELFTQATQGKERVPMEMTFDRLIESFYMTALLQLGAIRQEGEAPAVDVMGARQTIDSLTILQEKTKGNLSDREQNLLQNILFELRMAWIEITNAIAKGAVAGPAPGSPISGIKK